MSIVYRPKPPHRCDLVDSDDLDFGTIDRCDVCGVYRRVAGRTLQHMWEPISEEEALAIIEAKR